MGQGARGSQAAYLAPGSEAIARSVNRCSFGGGQQFSIAIRNRASPDNMFGGFARPFREESWREVIKGLRRLLTILSAPRLYLSVRWRCTRACNGRASFRTERHGVLPSRRTEIRFLSFSRRAHQAGGKRRTAGDLQQRHRLPAGA